MIMDIALVGRRFEHDSPIARRSQRDVHEGVLETLSWQCSRVMTVGRSYRKNSGGRYGRDSKEGP
jgi:hypothetical protein